MKVIRFKVEGVLNSFRIPFFRTYHRSFLAPPKTTIIGMLCNISLKPQKEFFELLNEDKIDVSVIIDKILGKSKDLWSYKTLDKKNRGKSVVRREKIFMPSYTIYLAIKDKKLYQEILYSLRFPQNIPSLGLDDELIVIKCVEEIELKINNTHKIDCIFLDKGYKYKINPKLNKRIIELPMFNSVPTKFKAFDIKGKRISKEPIKEGIFNQVEFINCEVELLENIETFIDEKNNRILFY